eukprot:6401549-Amphidinium_carterae.1
MELCRSRDHQEVPCPVVDIAREKEGQLEPKVLEGARKDRRQTRTMGPVGLQPGPRAGIVFSANSTIYRIVLCACSARPPKVQASRLRGAKARARTLRARICAANNFSKNILQRQRKDNPELKEHPEAALAAVTAKKTNALPVKDQRAKLLSQARQSQPRLIRRLN